MFLLSASSLALSGCNTISDIENWIPVGEKSFQTIVTLLENAGIINPLAGGTLMALIGLITTGFNDLLLAVQEYKSTTPAPVGTLAKVQTLFADITSNFQNFLSQLNLSGNPILALIEGLATIILSTISVFVNQLPATARASLKIGVLHMGSMTVSSVPIQRSIRKYKSDWNNTCVEFNYPEAKLHVSFLEHL